MSTLQVANVHLESTGNNRVQYTGSNTIAVVSSGSNVVVANSTTFFFNVPYTEKVYTLSTGSLDPTNGTLQRIDIAANVTFTDSLANGQSMILMVNNYTSSTITWPTVKWKDGSSPALSNTKFTGVQFFKMNTILFGVSFGDY